MQASAPRRAVVFGASNVYRNLATVVAASQAAWGGPLELLIAAGHGRSFGMWNNVLGYSVPGIIHCGLWDALTDRRDRPTAALITDVGNDLLYGASPETILNWVATCLDRLQPICERIVMTQLPVESVKRLTPAQFLLLSRILFPRSRLTLSDALERTHRLNEGIVALAKNYSVHLVAPKKDWYGFDPIHVRRRHVANAWHTLLVPWSDDADRAAARGEVWQWCRLRAHRTHVQRFLSRQSQTPQPAVRYPDGSSVSLY